MEAFGILVVGTPGTNRLESLTVTFRCNYGPNACKFIMLGYFNSEVSERSAFGAGITEVPFLASFWGVTLAMSGLRCENCKSRCDFGEIFCFGA